MFSLRLQVIYKEGQSPLQEGFKATSIGKASSSDPQVFHQAQVLHLVSDQNFIKPACRGIHLLQVLWQTYYSTFVCQSTIVVRMSLFTLNAEATSPHLLKTCISRPVFISNIFFLYSSGKPSVF